MTHAESHDDGESRVGRPAGTGGVEATVTDTLHARAEGIRPSGDLAERALRKGGARSDNVTVLAMEWDRMIPGHPGPGNRLGTKDDVRALPIVEIRKPEDCEFYDLDVKYVDPTDIHRIPARTDVPEHLHYDVRFALRATGVEEYRVSGESHDLAWVPLDDVESYSREWSVLRMKQKWLHQDA